MKGKSPVQEAIKVDRIAKMRSRGLVPVSEVCVRTGYNQGTISRWIKDNKVAAEKMGGQYFVSWVGVIKHIGIGPSVTLGLISKEQAEQLQKVG